MEGRPRDPVAAAGSARAPAPRRRRSRAGPSRPDRASKASALLRPRRRSSARGARGSRLSTEVRPARLVQRQRRGPAIARLVQRRRPARGVVAKRRFRLEQRDRGHGAPDAPPTDTPAMPPPITRKSLMSCRPGSVRAAGNHSCTAGETPAATSRRSGPSPGRSRAARRADLPAAPSRGEWPCRRARWARAVRSTAPRP